MGRRTQSQIQADRLVELEREKQRIEAERQGYEAAVKKAQKAAGFARADVVEQLYELFDIAAETTSRKHADGTVTRVAADKDESRRSRRLLDAVTQLLDAFRDTGEAQADEAAPVADQPPREEAEQVSAVAYS